MKSESKKKEMNRCVGNISFAKTRTWAMKRKFAMTNTTTKNELTPNLLFDGAAKEGLQFHWNRFHKSVRFCNIMETEK